MELAKDKLVVARDLLAAGHYNDVVSKAYYAMFYASKSLLLAVGQTRTNIPASSASLDSVSSRWD